jgi:hypothetical protein
MVDEGKVAFTSGELGSSPWIHSFSAALTLRAGGLPQVYLLFSWGGNEGTHTIANVNNSLRRLGSSFFVLVDLRSAGFRACAVVAAL